MEPFEKKGMEEKGAAHVFAAFKYSMDGLKVLLREEAAKLECVMLIVAAVLFAISGVDLVSYVILVGLFLFVLLIEALNTAIELIVDKTSPEISDYGKQVKDLGSFAVFCALSMFNGFAALKLIQMWLL